VNNVKPDTSPTQSHTPKHEAIRVLARWVRELRRDLRNANYRIRQLELRLQIQDNTPLNDIYSYWLDTHEADQLVQLAAELEAVG